MAVACSQPDGYEHKASVLKGPYTLDARDSPHGEVIPIDRDQHLGAAQRDPNVQGLTFRRFKSGARNHLQANRSLDFRFEVTA